MKVLTFILGILLAIAGVICLLNPGAAFIQTGYVIAIMLFVYGLAGLISVIARRARPAFLWASIPALIIGVISLFVPGDAKTIHVLLIYLLAFWFIVQGISSMYLSVRSRGFNSMWVLGLIVGIISVFLGTYTALHPLLGVFTIGILVGIFLIEAGIDMMVIGTTIGRVESFAKGAAAFVNEARNAAENAYEEAPAQAQEDAAQTPEAETAGSAEESTENASEASGSEE